MSIVYLGLGSNRNAEANIRAGIRALYRKFTNTAVSPVYRSKAVGFSGDDFLNCVARIETDLAPTELKHWLTELEDAYGRDRSQPKFSDRTLDIDILLYDDKAGCFDGLTLPRGEILQYAHVLAPLADLAPDLKHPETGKTFAEHWDEFEGDRSLEPADLGDRQSSAPNWWGSG